MHDELERERTPVDVASHERSFQDESHSGSPGTAYDSRLPLKQGGERSFTRSIPSGLCVFIPLLVFRFREMKLLRNAFRNLPSGDFPVFYIRVDFFAYDFLPEKWEFRARLRGGNFKVSCP